ncbi:2-dehydro-3-deoxy-D-gluconate 5-dehydrogenase KduD [Pseudolysobacter antarcticus]|uniref:2-dehydro-3-deoxy-D-gluconate 5-dehydrogenase KduD n=1 Tax=Pseudolysobacter antarcticus TaxID=2511995 RepID=A0A411HQ28_9GAMM|nr:2-dehydro-3-deoxy-D-gluconate 5-dehydrogenase KduD [Pseudolysobacter antarcticus]QBB72530.1 2-dehydro-3-deoxy-D-gluconate 5-dehydrogenase KduD [Pseudolysobacter antarcticus]
MNDLFRLDGCVALVTGANTGLGQAIAIALAQAGADIAAVGRTAPHETLAAITAVGRRGVWIEANLDDSKAAPAIIDTAVAQLGGIDILINNAGTIRRNDALDFTEDDWDSVVDVNLKSAFFLCQAVARRWVAENRGGKIINIASMLSFQGGIRVASYTASKSGLLGITRLLANEWAARGINVNAIAPGYFATNNTTALRADEMRNRAILERIPAARWGDPADLGGAAVFLASRASDYVHGAVLAVDGGWLAR